MDERVMVGVYATVPAGVASASAGVGADSTAGEGVCTAATAGVAGTYGDKAKVKGAPRNGKGRITVVDTVFESLIKSSVI
jgi:hypothetical protein